MKNFLISEFSIEKAFTIRIPDNDSCRVLISSATCKLVRFALLLKLDPILIIEDPDIGIIINDNKVILGLMTNNKNVNKMILNGSTIKNIK